MSNKEIALVLLKEAYNVLDRDMYGPEYDEGFAKKLEALIKTHELQEFWDRHHKQ